MQGMQGPIQQTGVPQLTYQGSSAAPSQHGTQPSSGEQHTGEVAHDAHVTPDDSKTVSQHQGNANLEQMGSSSQAKQNQPAEKTLSSMFKSALGAVQGGLSKFVATTGKAIMNAGHGVSDFARDIRNEIEAGDFIDNRKANLSYLADKASQKTGIGLDSKIQKQEAEVKGLEQKVASDTQSLKDLNDEKAQVTQQRDNAPNQTLKDAYNDKLGKLDKQIDQHETSLEGNSSKLEIAQTRLDELKNAHGASMLTSASRMAGNVKPLAEGLAGRIGLIEMKRPESSNDTKLSASKEALADLTKADNEIGRQLNDLKATLSKYPENPTNPEQAKLKTSIQNQIKTLMNQRISNTRSFETLGNDIKGMEGKQKTEDATFREQNPTLKDWASDTVGRISTVASNMFSKISTSEGRQEIKEGIGNTLGDLKDAAGTKLGELKDAAGTKLGELKEAAKEKLGITKDKTSSGESEGVEAEGQQVATNTGPSSSELKDASAATAAVLENLALPNAETLTQATPVSSQAILNPEHPIPPPQVHTDTVLFPTMLSDVKQANKVLGGSTGAKLMETEGGEKFVQKEGPVAQQGAKGAAAHITAEYHANLAYKAIGVNVPEVKLYTKTSSDAINGQEGASPATPVMLAGFVKDAKPLGEYLANCTQEQKEALLAKVQKDFIADVMLANWDVVGMGMDNILVTSDGTPVRIDNGSCFEFRAQGDQKAIPKIGLVGFSSQAIEVDSFRNPQINPQAAQIFGSISDQEIIRQIDDMAGKFDQLLAATPQKYHAALEGRMQYLQEYKQGLEQKLGIKHEPAANAAAEAKDKSPPTAALSTTGKATNTAAEAKVGTSKSEPALAGKVKAASTPSKAAASGATNRVIRTVSQPFKTIAKLATQKPVTAASATETQKPVTAASAGKTQEPEKPINLPEMMTSLASSLDQVLKGDWKNSSPSEKAQALAFAQAALSPKMAEEFAKLPQEQQEGIKNLRDEVIKEHKELGKTRNELHKQMEAVKSEMNVQNAKLLKPEADKEAIQAELGKLQEKLDELSTKMDKTMNTMKEITVSQVMNSFALSGCYGKDEINNSILNPEKFLLSFIGLGDYGKKPENMFQDVNNLLADNKMPPEGKHQLMQFLNSWAESGLFEKQKSNPMVKAQLSEIIKYGKESGDQTLQELANKLEISSQPKTSKKAEVESSETEAEDTKTSKGDGKEAPTLNDMMSKIGKKGHDKKQVADTVQAMRASAQEIHLGIDLSDGHPSNILKPTSSFKPIAESFNQTSNFVAESVLHSESVSEAQRKYAFAVDVMIEAFNQGDFHTAQSILAGLNFSAVHRLHLEEDLSKKTYAAREQVINVMLSVTKPEAHHPYQTELRTRRANDQTVIPYLGQFNTDLTFAFEKYDPAAAVVEGKAQGLNTNFALFPPRVERLAMYAPTYCLNRSEEESAAPKVTGIPPTSENLSEKQQDELSYKLKPKVPSK